MLSEMTENAIEGRMFLIVKQEIPDRILGKGKDLEYIVIDVWDRNEPNIITSFYNSCFRLELRILCSIKESNHCKVIWCGDFNSHNRLEGHSQIIMVM